MAYQRAALHKDVARIFNGVWTPQIDNIQQQSSVTSPSGVSVANFHPKPLALERWSKKTHSTKKIQKAKLPKRTAWSFFSPKARREQKRLSSISKNLLINLPS
jgi:hypothetical protein